MSIRQAVQAAEQIAIENASRKIAESAELAQRLYLAAFTGCCAADMARSLAIEDQRRRENPNTPPEPIKLQADLVTGVARAYAQVGFQVLTGQRAEATVERSTSPAHQQS